MPVLKATRVAACTGNMVAEDAFYFVAGLERGHGSLRPLVRGLFRTGGHKSRVQSGLKLLVSDSQRALVLGEKQSRVQSGLKRRLPFQLAMTGLLVRSRAAFNAD